MNAAPYSIIPLYASIRDEDLSINIVRGRPTLSPARKANAIPMKWMVLLRCEGLQLFSWSDFLRLNLNPIDADFTQVREQGFVYDRIDLRQLTL